MPATDIRSAARAVLFLQSGDEFILSDPETYAEVLVRSAPPRTQIRLNLDELGSLLRRMKVPRTVGDFNGRDAAAECMNWANHYVSALALVRLFCNTRIFVGPLSSPLHDPPVGDLFSLAARERLEQDAAAAAASAIESIMARARYWGSPEAVHQIPELVDLLGDLKRALVRLLQ